MWCHILHLNEDAFTRKSYLHSSKTSSQAELKIARGNEYAEHKGWCQPEDPINPNSPIHDECGDLNISSQ